MIVDRHIAASIEIVNRVCERTARNHSAAREGAADRIHGAAHRIDGITIVRIVVSWISRVVVDRIVVVAKDHPWRAISTNP